MTSHVWGKNKHMFDLYYVTWEALHSSELIVSTHQPFPIPQHGYEFALFPHSYDPIKCHLLDFDLNWYYPHPPHPLDPNIQARALRARPGYCDIGRDSRYEQVYSWFLDIVHDIYESRVRAWIGWGTDTMWG